VLEYSVTLRKGARSRFHEDALVSRLVLQALADASHVRAPSFSSSPCVER
jgi:hypothetical protein